MWRRSMGRRRILRWKKLASGAVVSSDRMSNSTKERIVTHPLTNHDIVRLRHQERVALGHAAMHSLEAREAGSTKSETGNQRTGSWLDRLRRRQHATPRTPARTGTS